MKGRWSRRAVVVTLSLVVSVGSAACGSDGGDGDAASDRAASTTSTTEVRVVAGCEIRPETACPGANFQGADLRGANLRDAKLQSALFLGVALNDADLRGADLTGADFQEADLSGADLTGSTITSTLLSRSNLTGAKLADVRFEANPSLWDAKGLDVAVLEGVFDLEPLALAHFLADNDVFIDPHLPSLVAPACRGTPIPDAGAALAESTFRPLVTVLAGTGIASDAYTHPPTEGMRAALFGFARLVVCVDEDTFPVLGTCGPYTPERGGETFTVTIRSEHLRLRVVDPVTGTVVATRTFDGGSKLDCPLVVFIGGSEDRVVDTNAVNKWLAPLVQPAA